MYLCKNHFFIHLQFQVGHVRKSIHLVTVGYIQRVVVDQEITLLEAGLDNSFGFCHSHRSASSFYYWWNDGVGNCELYKLLIWYPYELKISLHIFKPFRQFQCAFIHIDIILATMNLNFKNIVMYCSHPKEKLQNEPCKFTKTIYTYGLFGD